MALFSSIRGAWARALHRLDRLGRVAFAGALVLGLTFAGTGSVAAIGGGSAIVSTQVHDADHNVVTTVTVGTRVHPRFQVSGASGTPSGEIGVSKWNNATCSGTHDYIYGGVLSNGSLDAHFLAETSDTATTISYRGDYDGNGIYGPVSGQCVTLTFVKANPTVAITMHTSAERPVTSVKIGTTIHAFAEVGGALDTPTGSVRIRQWPNGTCSGLGSLVGPYALSGGEVDTPYGWAMNAAGTFSFRADYLGNGTYNTTASPCLHVTVHKYTPTFTSELRDPANQVVGSVPVSTTVHAHAALSGSVGTPTGVVTVKQYTGGSCAGSPFSTQLLGAFPVIDPAGQPISSSTPTSLSWQLSYGGDANYDAATGPCLAARWKVAPTIDVAVHDASHAAVTHAVAGTLLHLDVEVGGAWGTPTGAVTLTRYANGTCSGSATTIGSPDLNAGVIDQAKLDVAFKTAGTYSFKAAYAGDSTYLDKASGCVTVTITAPLATPTPTVAPTPAPTATPTAAPGATATPAATSSPTDAPAGSDEPNDGPTTTGQPVASAPAPTTAPDATSDAGPTSPADPIDAAQGGTGSGSGIPATPSTGSANGIAWVFPILLLLVLALLTGAWFARRRRQRESPMAA